MRLLVVLILLVLVSGYASGISDEAFEERFYDTGMIIRCNNSDIITLVFDHKIKTNYTMLVFYPTGNFTLKNEGKNISFGGRYTIDYIEEEIATGSGFDLVILMDNLSVLLGSGMPNAILSHKHYDNITLFFVDYFSKKGNTTECRWSPQGYIEPNRLNQMMRNFSMYAVGVMLCLIASYLVIKSLRGSINLKNIREVIILVFLATIFFVSSISRTLGDLILLPVLTLYLKIVSSKISLMRSFIYSLTLLIIVSNVILLLVIISGIIVGGVFPTF